MSADPLRYFRMEARELVDQISAGVLDLDQHPGTEPVARLLRFAHTLKGAARVVRQQEIADRAHAFEEVLVPHRSVDGPLPTDELRELLRLNDEIEAYVAALEPSAAGETAEPPAGDMAVPAPPTEGRQRPAAPGAAPAGDPAPVARAATADVDDLLDAVGEAHARFAPLRSGGASMDELHQAAESLAEQLRAASGAAPSEAARAAAQRLAADLSTFGRRLTTTVDQVERELDEIRGRAERLRLVAASSIFTALHRAVRDAADAQERRVHFEARGGDLRMDPHVLALASGALLHIVRNAVVHGIEPPEQRAQAGKPAEGTVAVAVERRGRYAAFLCTDDGRGFDLAALRRTAEARGLLAPGGPEPDERTLLDLVFRGGISTSPTVTEVAGRGIGLDMARDAAAQLGGDVSVRTTAGRGTTIELVLPLALLSLHGLVVEAAGTVATVPLDSVRTCVRLVPEQATAAAVTGKLAHDGEAVPFLPLARALYAGTTVPEGGGPGVAVLVTADGDSVAVGVDRLAGTSTLVVRPLPELAPAAAVIGGVAMDLDGNPRLVLDAHGLIAETSRIGAGGAAPPPAPPQRLPILVVDDSLTTRMLERSILESAGFEVDLAASGEEGLDKARSRRYGLYLTDIDMPGIDGFTFVAETRADPDLAGVPAILVSSRASAEDRARGTAVGASAYVVKGEFNQEELLAHIRRLVAS
ncbi:response regulator [Actinoplanes sp. NPDC051475]|uniref:hybrid sensor histidine kinase/response regulator n=1 Tax=Actinoplanes sp. NPDC051475 TaxID=3157225 RepID=UPI00344CB8B1